MNLHYFNKLLVLLVLVLVLVLFCKETPLLAKTLKFAITSNFAPYHFMDKDNKPRGIHFDILSTVINKFGYDLTLVTIPRKRLEINVKKGHQDVFPNALAWTSDLGNFVYTDTVSHVSDMLFTLKNSPLKFTRIEDLFGKKLIAIRGYNYPMLEPYFKNGMIMRINTEHELSAMEMLLLKRGDGAVVVDKIGKWLIAKNSWQGKFKKSNKMITDTEFRFIFNKKWKDLIPKINKELKALKNNGGLDKILDNYK